METFEKVPQSAHLAQNENGCLARTRIYKKPRAGLAPDESPSHLASQAAGAVVHDGAKVIIDDHLKEVLLNWSVIPPAIR
ncbi:MAG TPA: hypothetical protein VNH18_35185, partial [Bryobacteraceae bacterium]|nr:hypothetical protein [Bryobacteraceae bacterium]